MSSIVVVGLMTGAGWWAHRAIAASLSNLVSDSLTALLQSNMEALEMWIEAEKLEVQSWAQAPGIVQAVNEIYQVGRNSSTSATLAAAPAQQQLRDLLSPTLTEPDVFGFLLTNREGLVLAAEKDKLVGRRLTPMGQALNAATFSAGHGSYKPLDGSLLIDDLASSSPLPVILSAATVADEKNEPIAVLSLFLDPEQDFSRILSVGRLGETGSTYAFDRDGLMLSELRYEEDLTSLGLTPESPDPQSTLIVAVRDPGRNLLKGLQPRRPPSEQRLTKAVASAIKGNSRVRLKPYRDYRGVPVVGAWTWLPAHEFGVVTEIEADQVRDVLRPIKAAFWGMGVLIALLTVGIFGTAFVISRMRMKEKSQRVIGQYTLYEKIGAGGMGTVYKARHAMLRRPTAVKLLGADMLNPEMISRFEREVQITSQLTHPNTVEIYDYGRVNTGEFYYVMEYIDGVTLARLVEGIGKLPPARAVHFLKQVCASLVEAHQAGIIHRDIKPLNVMICKRGGQLDIVKVLDFGLVKDVINSDPIELTHKDIVRGTPLYISPERLRDPSIATPASDLYSIGVLAFNLLSGKDPFSGSSSLHIAEQVLHTEPMRLSSLLPELPESLTQLVWQCMKKDPAERPASVEEVLRRLLQLNLEWSQEDAESAWEHWEAVTKTSKPA